MSRFKSTIKALEVQVQRQQQALDELQAENEQMQQKEAALLSSLVTLQCGVSALASASAAQQQQSQDSSGRVSGHCSGPAAGSTACCSTGEDGTSPPAPDSTASAAGQQQDAAGVCGTTSSPASSQAAAQQGQEQQRVVQQLSALECMLEDTMLEVRGRVGDQHSHMRAWWVPSCLSCMSFRHMQWRMHEAVHIVLLLCQEGGVCAWVCMRLCRFICWSV